MNEDKKETSIRIQTSILNGVEKKVLIYLANRQPQWMTSNILTVIGIIGAIIISLGYILSRINLNYLWISSLGFVINWYGDSLMVRWPELETGNVLSSDIIWTIQWI